MRRIGAAAAAALLLAACGGAAGGGDAQAAAAAGRVTAANVRAAYPHPEDWHRLALYGNWDFVDIEAWRAIVTQPECDKATALAIFWMASPDAFLRYDGRAAVPPVNRELYGLAALIRERWQSGFYRRSEIAFYPDADVRPLDLAALRRQHGARVDALMPASMRVRLSGRRLDARGFRAPGVYGTD